MMGRGRVSAAAMAIAALGAAAMPPRAGPADRPLAPLPEGYDPTVIRSKPHYRPGKRTPHRRYYVCPCGMRSRLSWRFARHACPPGFTPPGWD